MDQGIQNIRKNRFWTPGAVGGSMIFSPAAVWGYKSSRLKGHGKFRAAVAGQGAQLGAGMAGGLAMTAGAVPLMRRAAQVQASNPALAHTLVRRGMASGVGAGLAATGLMGYGMYKRWQRNKRMYGR